MRVHKGELVLAHDPITRDGDDLVRLGELYDPGLEAMIVYLDFKQDAVVRAAEQIHRLGAFHRFVFFAEQREIVRSLATAKGRYPALVADASLLHVAVEELERWFGASLTFSFALPTRP